VKRIRIVLAAATAVAALGAGVVIAATNATAGDDTFARSLRNVGNGLCLQPADASMDAGTAIVQQPCDGSLAQEWGFLALGGTTFRMINHNSGLCIDAQGGNANGTPVIQWPCAAITNETFDSGVQLPGQVTMTSRVSGTRSHCIDVPGQQTTAGLAVQLWSCNKTVAQSWLVFSR
jgi:hypothetical protein